MAYTQTIPPDRTNYIKNPSFESAALTPWVLTGATSSTATVVTTKLHSGTHSLELTKTANEFPAILHDPKSGTTIGQIAVSKGNVYTFSHYYFLDSSSGSTVRV